MTKLDWEKARCDRQARACSYVPLQAPRPRATPAELHLAETARKISILRSPIRSGFDWLNTVPRTDPRHANWLQAIHDLQSERRLQSSLNARKGK